MHLHQENHDREASIHLKLLNLSEKSEKLQWINQAPIHRRVLHQRVLQKICIFHIINVMFERRLSLKHTVKNLKPRQCVVGVAAGCMAPFTAARSACRLRCVGERWLNTEAAGPGTAFNPPLPVLLGLCAAALPRAQLGHKGKHTCTFCLSLPLPSGFWSVRLSVDAPPPCFFFFSSA